MKISNSILSLLLAATPVVAFVPGAPRASLIQRTNSAAVQPLHAVQLPTQTPEVAKEAVGDLIVFFDSINQKLSEGFQSQLGTFLNSISSDAKELSQLANNPAVTSKVSQVTDTVNAALQTFIAQHPSLQPAYDTIQAQLQALPLDNVPAPVLGLVSSVVTFSVVSSLLSMGQAPPPSLPYPLHTYDPAAARVYFDSRLPQVIARSLEIATASLGFGLSLLKDYTSDDLEAKAEERAVELAELLTMLGPSFIKIGQSLSIRTDLLSPAYVRGLKTLQDQVPPFDTKIAKQILEDEWGKPVDSVLSKISDEPVAAASLGQVYRATLKSTGEEVAIKVLRPNIEGQIALDMHIIRELAPVVKSLFNLNTDTVGIVDTWGTGFVNELDYVEEAKNAQIFTEGIKETPLKDVVFAPGVVEELSTTKVLTTEWVEGERLDRSNKEDVTVLCSIAMNTYLTMMLELGTLHSDPHPGNLLRTPEGKLCILDWGMVTKLDKDLQLTLITHMAHLTSRDYEEIPRDLLLLGFIPEDKADMIEDSGIVEVLADIYGAWTNGGGAAAINVNKVITQLQDLTALKGNLFRVPAYFVYIAKCFSVLEGIGLSNDAKYSIVNECLPYVSKRLLTDDNGKTGAALSTFIFGPEKGNLDTRIVDYKRVEQLVEGFSSYSTSAAGALLGKENLSRTQMLEASAEQVLDLIFTEEETPLQEILIEQSAKIIGAGSRSLWTELKQRSGSLPNGRTVLGTVVDPLGLWRTSPIVRMNKMDEDAVQMTRSMIGLMQSQLQDSNNSVLDPSTISREEAIELSTILGQKVWERRNGVLKTSSRLATQLLQLTAKKLETGERETLTLPVPTKVVDEEPTVVVASSGSVLPPLGAPFVKESPQSDRLKNARQLLTELEEPVVESKL